MNDQLLLLIPKKNQYKFSENIHNGCVEIIVPRDGLLDRMMRLFYKTPKVMHIHLDDRGSFVWQVIDGSRTIRDIGTMVEAEFGERVAPLYERLIIFLYALKRNGFIALSRPERIPGKSTG